MLNHANFTCKINAGIPELILLQLEDIKKIKGSMCSWTLVCNLSECTSWYEMNDCLYCTHFTRVLVKRKNSRYLFTIEMEVLVMLMISVSLDLRNIANSWSRNQSHVEMQQSACIRYRFHSWLVKCSAIRFDFCVTSFLFFLF